MGVAVAAAAVPALARTGGHLARRAGRQRRRLRVRDELGHFQPQRLLLVEVPAA
ncbi:MAG TPA: hypothetical protein PL091_14235 [Actinomycetota bacterium]|nr:hypothetical protein [Actinomycetota bacterium]